MNDVPQAVDHFPTSQSSHAPALTPRSIWARFSLLFCLGLFAVFLAPVDPFGEPLSTAVATLLLLASVLVLSLPGAVVRRRIVSGFEPGAAVGFFLRQAHDFPRLAPGAQRMLLASSLIWAGAVALRWWRSRL